MIAVCLSVQSKSSLKLLFFITFLLDRELKWQPLPPEYDKYIAHISAMTAKKSLARYICATSFVCVVCKEIDITDTLYLIQMSKDRWYHLPNVLPEYPTWCPIGFVHSHDYRWNWSRWAMNQFRWCSCIDGEGGNFKRNGGIACFRVVLA